MIDLVLILASILVDSDAARTSGADEGCRPTYVLAAADNFVVRFHPLWEVEFNGVLIGCEADLATIDASALAAIQEELRALAHEKHFNLYREAEETEFRQDVCGKLNKALGRELFADIFFHELALTEFRPEEPPGGGGNPAD